jgi:hypothetical protein
MKLREYLQHRGGNNITIAEASAIGIVISPGWPHKYEDRDVPEKLAIAVAESKNMPWSKRRKFLRDLSAGNTEQPSQYDLIASVKALLYQAMEVFPADPYEAMGFVDEAICFLENKETETT